MAGVVEHASAHLHLLSHDSENYQPSYKSTTFHHPSSLCLGASGFLHFIALTCCLGSLCIGLILGYTSPAVPNMTFLNQEEASWFVSIVALAAILGAIFTGILMDRFGRKLAIVACVPTPFCLGWVCIIAANHVSEHSSIVILLLLGRFLNGIGVGAGSLCIPTYLAEITTSKTRGTIGTMHQLFVEIGIELAYLMGADNGLNWVWQALSSMFPVALYSLLALLTPQSPRWLISRGLSHEARSCLQKLRKSDYNINRELQEYEDACSETMGPSGSRWTRAFYGGVSHLAATEERASNGLKKVPSRHSATGVVGGAGGVGVGGTVVGAVGNGGVGGRELHEPRTSVLKPLLITLGLMVAQQFSGINSMIFNMESIFTSVGFNDDKKAAIIIGATQVIATLFSVLLIDNIGRRKLLMVSALGMAVSMMLMGICEYYDGGNLSTLSLTSMFFYIIFFCIGFGPVPNLIMSEVLPLQSRGVAASIASAVNFSATFVVTKTFHNFKAVINPSGTYWFYSSCCVVSFFFCYWLVPETKGKTLEEIERFFHQKRHDTGRRSSITYSWSIISRTNLKENEET